MIILSALTPNPLYVSCSRMHQLFCLFHSFLSSCSINEKFLTLDMSPGDFNVTGDFDVTVCHSLPQFATVCHCLPLFATVCHCMPLFATVCHCLLPLPLFPDIYHCLSPFANIGKQLQQANGGKQWQKAGKSRKRWQCMTSG